jgi:hypothetical protein
MGSRERRQRIYDHRLRELVRRTGDASLAMDLGVPRSTAVGWVGGQVQSRVVASPQRSGHEGRAETAFGSPIRALTISFAPQGNSKFTVTSWLDFSVTDCSWPR